MTQYPSCYSTILLKKYPSDNLTTPFLIRAFNLDSKSNYSTNSKTARPPGYPDHQGTSCRATTSFAEGQLKPPKRRVKPEDCSLKETETRNNHWWYQFEIYLGILYKQPVVYLVSIWNTLSPTIMEVENEGLEKMTLVCKGAVFHWTIGGRVNSSTNLRNRQTTKSIWTSYGRYTPILHIISFSIYFHFTCPPKKSSRNSRSGPPSKCLVSPEILAETSGDSTNGEAETWKSDEAENIWKITNIHILLRNSFIGETNKI